MQPYIAHLIAVPDEQMAVHNAALAYLVLMHSFASDGLLQLAWATRLVIAVGIQEHEVRNCYYVEDGNLCGGCRLCWEGQ
jgi:hypothetical protein